MLQNTAIIGGLAGIGGKPGIVTKEQREIINGLNAEPFILDEDRVDIEGFLQRFPGLVKSFIPVSIIGEGTFSTVYKAIDVQHFELQNSSWLQWSRQDPEDAPRLLAFVQKMQEEWQEYFKSNGGSEEERRDKLASFSTLNVNIKNYVHHYLSLLLSSQQSIGTRPPQIVPQFVALKRINPTSSPERLLDEISFLKDLGGKHNVVPIIAGLRYQDQVIVVFPYFHCRDFREYLSELSALDIAHYMRLLFEALTHIHSHNVIHRDIKPSNFLFSPSDRRAVLVDFGLAQVLLVVALCRHTNAHLIKRKQDGLAPDDGKRKRDPEEMERQAAALKEKLAKLPPGIVMNDMRPVMKASRAGTRGFRAPEVLFKCVNQTCALDIWSAGVILLTLLTRRYPFFQSSDDQDAIVEIACLFGNKEMEGAAQKYGRQWKSNVPSVPGLRVGWERLVKKMNPELQVPRECYDLLDKCLRLNVEERLTAGEALEHPFIKQHCV